MQNPDTLLYAVHNLFWTTFGVTLLILKLRYRRAAEGASPAPVSKETHTAGFSRAFLAFHMVAFGVMYFGIFNAVQRQRVPFWFARQRISGTIVVAIGVVLMVSALTYFRSWRFRATLDQGHQLATGGPFRILRHPIYMALNLLALGSAIWVPTPILWIAAVLMAVGSDLRGRAEERILEDAFGDSYRDYRRRTARFLPGIY